ncbi:30S ribosomal protein S2 [Candidatus Woesearchaeota archaeon]|nr:30S ribosomal protein S2 [Candidatus Woesearchaeota archaeon]
MAETQELLVPVDTYSKAGIHIGTKFKTKHMEDFIYKIKPDGLVILNLQKIDERIRIASDFLANYSPEEIVVVAKRENAWKPLKLFSQLTGVTVYPGRYSPGTLTNLAYKNFAEFKVMIVVDAWLDKNAVDDAKKMGMPVVALCDTNNVANNLDLIIPCNNKGRKSLGLVLWILAREYLQRRGLLQKNMEPDISLDEFWED